MTLGNSETSAAKPEGEVMSRYSKIWLCRDDLRLLCDVLQPVIDKGDLRALQMYWEFQAILDPANAKVLENAQALRGNYSPTTTTIHMVGGGD